MPKINWGIIGPGSIANAFSYSIKMQQTQNSSVFMEEIHARLIILLISLI